MTPSGCSDRIAPWLLTRPESLEVAHEAINRRVTMNCVKNVNTRDPGSSSCELV
jgi:hypothetical protein